MQQLSFELLLKYFSGDATPEEALRIEDWRREHEEHEQYFTELFKAWNDSPQYTRPDKGKLWLQFNEQINNSAPAPSIQKKRPFMGWKVAAAVAILIAIGSGIFYYTRLRTLTFTASNNKDTVALPDATHAVLDKDAVLTFGYDKDRNRILKLDGNATFNITDHQSGLTLQLSSGLHIQDIGTQFKVMQGRDAGTITVYDGKLKIWLDSDTVVLEKNKVLAFNNTDKVLSVKDYTGTFTFKDESLAEICKQMTAYYHTDIIVADSSLSRASLTITCHDATLDEIIAIITSTLEATSSKDKNGNISIK